MRHFAISTVHPFLIALAIASFCMGGMPAHSQSFDILLKNGTVVDGTGAPRLRADVGIRGEKIAFVGLSDDATAANVIDVSGLVVAPGFIDVHNHTTGPIAGKRRRLNEGFVRQGVTTVVGGPDGGLDPVQIARLLKSYEKNGIGTNVALYVGHNAIRKRVMGIDQQRAPTPDELKEMQALVREGMEMGAVGFSTGLMYEPGMFSDTDEVVALAKMAAPFNGVYDSHVRSPVHAFLESHTECAEIGERAGIPAKLGHLKGVGLQNEGVIRDIIDMVENHREAGRNVVSDQYPYDGAATSTIRAIVVIPKAMYDAEGFDLNRALLDPAKRRVLKKASEEGIDGGFAWLKATGYSSMRITDSEDFPELEGEYLSLLAAKWEVDSFDAVSKLLIEAEHPVYITLGAIKEPDVRTLLVQPWNMVASDGEYVDSSSRASGGHPRSTGTFPRVLGHYVRDEGVLSLEEAIRKLTSLPAEFIRLTDRGRIAEDMAADITVFDPKTIIDRSTWTEPKKMPEGVIHVFVNGVAVLSNGELTGEASGRFLRPTR